jgi:hypothetical protein
MIVMAVAASKQATAITRQSRKAKKTKKVYQIARKKVDDNGIITIQSDHQNHHP